MHRDKSDPLSVVTRAPDTDYERIFHPKRVAIAGVSPGGGSGFGTLSLLSLQAMGFEGEIFPVNPKGGEITGLKIYRRVEDIPGKLDLVVVVVAAEESAAVLEAGRRKGAAGGIIITSGFSETATPEGVAREEEIRQIAAKGIRVIGPNCFGIYCPRSGLTFIPNPDLSRESGRCVPFTKRRHGERLHEHGNVDGTSLQQSCQFRERRRPAGVRTAVVPGRRHGNRRHLHVCRGHP